MSGSLLTFLKYIFIAVLYLFFFRVLRAVWTELRDPGPAPRHDHNPEPETAPPVARAESVHRVTFLEPPDLAGRSYTIDNEITVGRASSCTIPLKGDTFASSVHARIYRRDRECYVEDMGSTNGTLLNGQKVTSPVALRGGDRLKIGHSTMELSQ